MGPEFGSQWISEHLHFNCFLAMSGWPRKTPVNCHSPPLEWKGVEGGCSPPTSNLVCFLLNLEEASYAQSEFCAIQAWGVKRFRGASSKMARYSFVNLVESAQIKNTCFYLFLAFACQGPAPKHFGLVRKSLWSPNYTQHARKPLCFNRSWIFGQDLQLIHTCISFVHENPFHPLARQFRGASHVRRKRGTVPLAGACSGMALEDRRYTHAKHFSILKHESRAKQNLWVLVWLWHQCGHHSEGLAVDIDHEDDFSSIEQGVNETILKKSLVLVASHAKCRSKLVMIDLACNCSRVAYCVNIWSNGPQNGCLLWRNPQHSNTCCAENQRPQNGCWMPFMAHMAWS